MKYRSIFISDVHLGTINSQADKLNTFLKENDYKNLFLVGDIIDIQQMRKSLFWKKSHNKVIQRILKLSKSINVYYILGNHDNFLEIFINENFGGIQILKEMKYTTLKGEKCLILHGDQFDGIITRYKFIYYIGDWAYSFALWLNRIYNLIRVEIFKKNYWSLSQWLKTQVKDAIKFINNFSDLVVQRAKDEKVDTVICGHIHHAEDKNIEGIRYLNSGCWTEYCSAIVEKENGDLELIYIN